MKQKHYKEDPLEEALDLHLEDLDIDLDLESIDLIDFDFKDEDFNVDFSDIDTEIDLTDLDYTIEKLFKDLDNINFNIDYEAIGL